MKMGINLQLEDNYRFCAYGLAMRDEQFEVGFAILKDRNFDV